MKITIEGEEKEIAACRLSYEKRWRMKRRR